jgi:hypothetical protein
MLELYDKEDNGQRFLVIFVFSEPKVRVIFV